MEIVAIPPLSVATLKWQEIPGQWTLTLVCKLTFSVEEGTCRLAPAQEPIVERDNRWDDDLEGGVYAPCDLVPYKPRPEVVLVGSVFAPNGTSGDPIFARLAVGALDKSIEVFPQGEATPAAGLGPLAARWPERTDGLGPIAPELAPDARIEAPLGMDLDSTYFQCAPDDQRVDDLHADEPIVLEHLHPAHEQLITRLPGVRPRTRVELAGMPPWELDLTPDTLWIDTNRSICTLVWRGQLPLDGRDQPGRIFVGIERPGEAVAFPEVPAPTLRKPPVASEAVDDDAEQTQTNDDALEKTGVQAVPFATSPALPFGPTAPAPIVAPPPPRPSRSSPDLGQTSAFGIPAVRSRMPTWLGGTAAPEAGAPRPPASAHPAAAPVVPPPTPSQSRIPAPPPPGAVPPPAPSQSRIPMPLPAPSQGHVPVPPPPVAQLLRPGEPAPIDLTAASNRAAGLDEAALPGIPLSPAAALAPGLPLPPIGGSAQPVIGPVPGMPSGLSPGIAPLPLAPPKTTVGQATVAAAADLRPIPPPRPSQEVMPVALDEEGTRPRRSDPRSLATAAFLGAAEASTAAAVARDEGAVRRARKSERPAAAQAPAQAPARTVVDLLWFAPELPQRLSAHAAFKRLLKPEAPPPPPPEEVIPDEELPEDAPPRKKRKPPPPPEKTPEEKAREDRAKVARVISRGEPTVDVEGALFSAVDDDGVLDPPLLVVPGDLELPFDEVETLKVLASAAAPLAVGDKKLKETLDLANEALGTPLGSSPEVAASFSARVRDAWLKANRILSPDYLEVHSRRVLLEQRKYQMRELMGSPWIRALLHGPMTERPVPAYLPADLAKKLPLFVKFPARLIAEALPAQDQNEQHPAALRVLALARALPGRARR